MFFIVSKGPYMVNPVWTTCIAQIETLPYGVEVLVSTLETIKLLLFRMRRGFSQIEIKDTMNDI